jgi:hypothetical protein
MSWLSVVSNVFCCCSRASTNTAAVEPLNGSGDRRKSSYGAAQHPERQDYFQLGEIVKLSTNEGDGRPTVSKVFRALKGTKPNDLQLLVTTSNDGVEKEASLIGIFSRTMTNAKPNVAQYNLDISSSPDRTYQSGTFELRFIGSRPKSGPSILGKLNLVESASITVAHLTLSEVYRNTIENSKNRYILSFKQDSDPSKTTPESASQLYFLSVREHSFS